MAVFRIQDNVPDSYNRPSRDFQLLCNTFDCMNGAIKYDINSIKDVTDTNLCNDVLLNKLQTKVGFFSSLQINTEVQRLILKAFPYLIKYKGSRAGIKEAIYIYLKTQNINQRVDITVVNNSKALNSHNISIIDDLYFVNLGLNVQLKDIHILTELLKYIIPAGYGVSYSKVSQMGVPPVKAYNKIKNNVNIIFVSQFVNDTIRDAYVYDDKGNEIIDNSINAVSTTSIPSNIFALIDNGRIDTLSTWTPTDDVNDIPNTLAEIDEGQNTDPSIYRTELTDEGEDS